MNKNAKIFHDMLIQYINESHLPIALAYYILESILKDLKEIYDQAILAEQQEDELSEENYDETILKLQDIVETKEEE